MVLLLFVFYQTGDHPELHFLAHSFPTRRPSDLAARLDATVLRGWAHAAVEDLISHTDEINGLNVFPVADADTGTNMLFTMRSAWSKTQGCEIGRANV